MRAGGGSKERKEVLVRLLEEDDASGGRVIARFKLLGSKPKPRIKAAPSDSTGSVRSKKEARKFDVSPHQQQQLQQQPMQQQQLQQATTAAATAATLS